MDIRQLSLPAGVGLTHVKVYDEPQPDGLIAGTAHIHCVCSEMYYIIAGTGQMELLSVEGYQIVDIQPHKLILFRPGVIHRCLNPHRNLEILAIMQNGGLPERGDFVITLPNEVLTSPAAYTAAVRVTNHADAIRRRDLASTGFDTLKAAMLKSRESGLEALRQFYRAACKIISPKVDGFEWVLKSGPQAELKDALDAVDFLRVGRTDHFEHARSTAIFPMNDPPKPGMCGELLPYALDETFLIEGKKVA
jgi:mannose-6-phosphate isomerase-like protein (cupin superfamily)